jgi:CoA-transferase family III
MEDPRVERWAASGAMALTGPPDGTPLGPPARLVDGLDALARPLPGLDALALLGERAALMGLWRRGTTSCGGSCRLLRARDDWVAVSLPRDEDMEAVPAWLELDDAPRTAPATWSAVVRAFDERDSGPLLERAHLLGLPVARVAVPSDEPHRATPPDGVEHCRLGPAPARSLRGLRVADLSALWAGPLCGDLLARVGAEVVKVESTARPDGARRGPAAFFDLLNGQKRSVALDLGRAEGRRHLQALLRRVDVVIEASRPRALVQMGVDAADLVAGGGPQVWISITGYGRCPHPGALPGPDRVAFGDDAAAAGGLVAWHEGTPMFCADAVADPLAGVAAAAACVGALAAGGRWLLDVSMAGVAAGLAGPTLPAPADLVAAAPSARTAERAAPPLGSDTDAVLAEIAGGR